MTYVNTYYVTNILSTRVHFKMKNPIKSWWEDLYPYQKRDIINGIILTVKNILIIIFIIYLIKRYL